MSVQTNNLYLLEDLDDASKTGQLANNDLAALRTVAHEARVIRKTYTVL